MIRDCDEALLPTDLGGVEYIDIKKGDEFRTSIQATASKIHEAIQSSKYKEIFRFLQHVTPTELLRREVVEQGGELVSTRTHVFVNSSQPVESKEPEFAQRVMENIRQGINYRYVFLLDDVNAEAIAKMIVALCKVSVSKLAKESTQRGFSDAATQSPFVIGPHLIKDNLLQLQKRLRIHMVEESYGLDYCVLNATSRDHARCYLRTPQVERPLEKMRWINWCSGEKVFAIAKQVRRLCPRRRQEIGKIIKSSTSCDFYEAAIRNDGDVVAFLDELEIYLSQHAEEQNFPHESPLSSFMHVLALIIRLYVLPISEGEFMVGSYIAAEAKYSAGIV